MHGLGSVGTHLLDELPEDTLRVAVRVEVGRVEGVDALVPRGLEDGEGLRIDDHACQWPHLGL